MIIEDRMAILDTISSMYYALDSSDIETLKNFYTKDAYVEFKYGDSTPKITTSRKELIDNLTIRRKFLDDQGITTRHYSSNIIVEDSSEVVHVELMSLITWQRLGEAGPEVVHTGISEYEFIKTENEWKVSKRKTKIYHD